MLTNFNPNHDLMGVLTSSLVWNLCTMVELDAGLAAQMAMTQQLLSLNMMKNTAAAEKKMADVVAQTVMAGNTGHTVDLYA
mgnify:CR=1 FL=1